MATPSHSLKHDNVHPPVTIDLSGVLKGMGRAFFAVPFAIFGVLHFLGANQMADAVPVPGGVFWVYFTGAAMIAASIGLFTGIVGFWAALGLAALLLIFILTIHLPGLGDPDRRHMVLANLLKDSALMGGALTWAGLLRRQTTTVQD